MYDITVYAAVIVAILLRVYLMKGSFTLPTFYKVGNDVSFNLGSLTSVIVGLIAALGLMQAQPDLFANWYVAGLTAYSAPQIVDSIVTKGTLLSSKSFDEDLDEDLDEAFFEDLDEDFDEDFDDGEDL